MEMRSFGRTGLKLSVLGFGCGAVGGLMVRGDPMDQERTIARAIGAGVNYFDTAVRTFLLAQNYALPIPTS
jgi:L-galactose dehydrogenase/L-glyceraldehyde 3-phosphate reductase